ncbi:glycoside hydrolase family 10 protein [Nodosilinea nodulosa]|uniref:glycoside hydrolase family 10 protein n=1 Tax=Nodosilinea nodulosa TaxID=416001 RepID=UPI00030CA64A|nr:family 10 glycosylhydrolase [Nodosilinea nodulosa]
MGRFCYVGLAVLTALLIGMAQSLVALPPAQAIASAPSEIRGVWLTNVDSQVLFSAQAVNETLRQLASHRFNTLYPAVWSWGYTLYPSQVGEWATGYKQGLYPDLEDQGRNEALESAQGDRDLLLELIQTAKDLNLSVIPWFEFGFMAPANSPLAQRHPDWLTQKQGALPTARLDLEGRHSRVWLNPFHPEVQQFILDLVAELVDNYDLDGLQLDDHFSLPVAFGYDPYTIDLYRQEHRGQPPPSNPYDAEWTRWRAAKITALVDRVFWTVKARRPNAVLSVSPNPAAVAYTQHLQDWPRWREMGYIEELIVQVYRDNVAGFRSALRDRDLQQARRHIPTGIGILTGLKDRPVPMALIQQQVQVARGMGFAGVSFFFYDTLWTLAEGESEGDRTQAVQRVFAVPRSRPSLAHAPNPTVASG